MATQKKSVRRTPPRPKKRVETQATEFLDYYDSLATFYKVDPLRSLFITLSEAEDEQLRFNAAKELLSYRYSKLKPVDSLLSPTLDLPDTDGGRKPIEYKVVVVQESADGKDPNSSAE